MGQRMQDCLYQTADTVFTLSDSGCRRQSIRQQMQYSLYQTADAGLSFFTQRMQYSLYQTADAGNTLSVSGCRRHSIRQRMQETLCKSLFIRQPMKESLYQIANA